VRRDCRHRFLDLHEASVCFTVCSQTAGFAGTAVLKLSPITPCRPAGLVGGGRPPHPGEVSLAHMGVLFLDEPPEFAPYALDTLRQPLEDGVVTVARATGSVRLPAEIQLVGAMNPCRRAGPLRGPAVGPAAGPNRPSCRRRTRDGRGIAADGGHAPGVGHGPRSGDRGASAAESALRPRRRAPQRSHDAPSAGAARRAAVGRTGVARARDRRGLACRRAATTASSRSRGQQ
jgi:hypothetical protein